MTASKKESETKKQAVSSGYQFKITLAESQPPIWRRILVPNGSLDDLHGWIQTAMGWTNSHLHRFKIDQKLYGNPKYIESDDCDMKVIDSLLTTFGDLLEWPHSPKKFIYEYDFGDGWLHLVEFEGIQEPPPRKKSPCCLEGERCCPLEDVGGVWGYKEFLAAIQDPIHEEHENYLEWAGEGFNPEEFKLAEATKAMRDGLPSWPELTTSLYFPPRSGLVQQSFWKIGYTKSSPWN